MIGCKQVGRVRELSNYREPLIYALEVNSPYTNTPSMHMVHKNPIECPAHGSMT